ncbi:MAG: hypothetical protein ISS48_00275 [Candidatus Aenigmarchaeota archaeon]|nr:hypothetical protein [Candidatus Aenigmarchaeota archaeon]
MMKKYYMVLVALIIAIAGISIFYIASKPLGRYYYGGFPGHIMPMYSMSQSYHSIGCGAMGFNSMTVSGSDDDGNVRNIQIHLRVEGNEYIKSCNTYTLYDDNGVLKRPRTPQPPLPEDYDPWVDPPIEEVLVDVRLTDCFIKQDVSQDAVGSYTDSHGVIHEYTIHGIEDIDERKFPLQGDCEITYDFTERVTDKKTGKTRSVKSSGSYNLYGEFDVTPCNGDTIPIDLNSLNTGWQPGHVSYPMGGYQGAPFVCQCGYGIEVTGTVPVEHPEYCTSKLGYMGNDDCNLEKEACGSAGNCMWTVDNFGPDVAPVCVDPNNVETSNGVSYYLEMSDGSENIAYSSSRSDKIQMHIIDEEGNAVREEHDDLNDFDFEEIKKVEVWIGVNLGEEANFRGVVSNYLWNFNGKYRENMYYDKDGNPGRYWFEIKDKYHNNYWNYPLFVLENSEYQSGMGYDECYSYGNGGDGGCQFTLGGKMTEQEREEYHITEDPAYHYYAGIRDPFGDVWEDEPLIMKGNSFSLHYYTEVEFRLAGYLGVYGTGSSHINIGSVRNVIGLRKNVIARGVDDVVNLFIRLWELAGSAFNFFATLGYKESTESMRLSMNTIEDFTKVPQSEGDVFYLNQQKQIGLKMVVDNIVKNEKLEVYAKLTKD